MLMGQPMFAPVEHSSLKDAPTVRAKGQAFDVNAFFKDGGDVLRPVRIKPIQNDERKDKKSDPAISRGKRRSHPSPMNLYIS